MAGQRVKSGGAVANVGGLFLDPGRPNSDNPLLPLQQEQPPPPDAWDHFQGDEIELLAVPSTLQAKSIDPPGDLSDPWYWDDPNEDQWEAITESDVRVGAGIPPEPAIDDPWDHWEPAPEVTVIESGAQTVDVDRVPDEIEWPWADGHEFDADWDALSWDSAPMGADVPPRSIEDAWDHWGEEIALAFIPGSFQRESTDRPPDEIEWPWADGQDFDSDWPEFCAFDSAPVIPNSFNLNVEDPWDHWAEEVENLAIHNTVQAQNIDPPGDAEDPWPWDDSFEDDWVAIVDDDDDPVIDDFVSPSAGVEDPWYWDDDASELEDFGTDPVGADVAPTPDDIEWPWSDGHELDEDWAALATGDSAPVGANVSPVPEDPPWDWSEAVEEDAALDFDQPLGANVDPVQEDPWYWDDSFEDEAGIDFAQPLGANVAPVPEDPIWDWSECVTDDEAFDLAQPVGANVDPSPDDIEWPWSDGHEADEDWPALTFDSAPVGANVDPVPEDPWDWSEYPDDDGALDFDQPQPIDVPQTALAIEDPWDWFEFPDDDASIDLDQPLGDNVDASPEDPWLWLDWAEDEWEGSTDPVSAPDLPTYQDDWCWETVEDEADFGSEPVAAVLDTTVYELDWYWEAVEDEWDAGSDAIGTVLDTTNFQLDWPWEEVEDEWQVILDDGDDAISADAVAPSIPEDPWDWFAEEIETLALTGSYQSDTAIPGSALLNVEDAWDHFAEEIALVALPVTRQQSPPLPPSTLLANSDENFHFYIGDVEQFHTDHFDNYDTDNALYNHEWHWEEVEDESFFGTDPIRTNAILLAPAPDEPWPHFDDPLGDVELEFGSEPVGRDLEPCPADAWEWTEDTGDETTALTALDQPQPPADPSNIEDAWPWWDDTGEETGDFEATASDFDISHAPIAIDDPWRWFDDEVDESPLFAALDAIDNTPIPPSAPPEDPPWDWSEAVEDPEPDPQHALVDIIPDVPSIGDESGPFDWPAEDTLGDEPTAYGNGPVGPDGCPACANTAKRWFGPTFVKFLQ